MSWPQLLFPFKVSLFHLSCSYLCLAFGISSERSVGWSEYIASGYLILKVLTL